MEREDFDSFVEFIYHKQPPTVEHLSPYAEIVFNYITTPGKLRDAWIEWREGKQND
jgi:hypothetical protein